MIRTNTWNRVRYNLYAPLYNQMAGLFNDSRRRSVELLNLQAGNRGLLLGAGIEIDLEFLPRDLDVPAIDVTPTS
jgi:phosphatidylethanolamine/phosphatidyl-N-methylethanolamine N-methyltransferase